MRSQRSGQVASACVASAFVLAAACWRPPPLETGAFGSGGSQREVPICDSDEFLQAVAQWQRADSIAREDGGDPGSQPYDSVMKREGAGPLHGLFKNPAYLNRNEMHDCQRFIMGAPDTKERTLGPLVAIYVDPDAVEQPSETGQVVAEIVDFSSSDGYAPLNVRPGMNCLWMKENPAGTWTSTVFRPSGGSCAGAALAPPPGAPTLTTTPRRLANASTDDDYPSTGRWMWDEETVQQFIGIRCGMAWCELTPDDVTPTTTGFSDTREIPGRYDEQYLSYVDGWLIKTLKPSNLFGRIAPGPASYYPTGGQQATAVSSVTETDPPPVAAEITLEGEDKAAREYYAHKLAIEAAPDRAHRSTDPIYLRVEGGVWRAWTDMRPFEQAFHLQPAPGRKHSGMGTTRWRWMETDEIGWMPCDNTCCPYKED